MSLGSQNIFVTWAPESLKGKPSRSIPPFNTIPDKEKREVQFEILHEDWNHYTLKTGQDVKIRLIVSHIFRTKYFANDGDPYYIVNSLATAEETPKKASALTP